MLYRLCPYPYVRKRNHSTAQQHSKNNEKTPENSRKRKKNVPSRVIIVCLIGIPYSLHSQHRSNRKKEKNEQKSSSLSLVRCPPLSRPSRNRFGPGKAFLPLCYSEPLRPSREKPGACRGPCSPARQSWCSTESLSL